MNTVGYGVPVLLVIPSRYSYGKSDDEYSKSIEGWKRNISVICNTYISLRFIKSGWWPYKWWLQRSVAGLLAATLHQRNPGRNHKPMKHRIQLEIYNPHRTYLCNLTFIFLCWSRNYLPRPVHPSLLLVFSMGSYLPSVSFLRSVLYNIVCPFVFSIWLLYCLSFWDLQLRINPLISSNFSSLIFSIWIYGFSKSIRYKLN